MDMNELRKMAGLPEKKSVIAETVDSRLVADVQKRLSKIYGDIERKDVMEVITDLYEDGLLNGAYEPDESGRSMVYVGLPDISDHDLIDAADNVGLRLQRTVGSNKDFEAGDESDYYRAMFGEEYKDVPPIDTERYQERNGLEGPFRTRSGKVVYYDPKVGKYYDPDSDFYISDEDYSKMDEDGAANLDEEIPTGDYSLEDKIALVLAWREYDKKGWDLMDYMYANEYPSSEQEQALSNLTLGKKINDESYSAIPTPELQSMLMGDHEDEYMGEDQVTLMPHDRLKDYMKEPTKKEYKVGELSDRDLDKIEKDADVDEDVDIGGEEETLLKSVPVEALGREFDRVTSLRSAFLDNSVRSARDAAKSGEEGARDVLLTDIFSRLKTRDPNAYKNLLRNLSKYSVDEEVVGELQNGYDDRHTTTKNHSDFFPTGADGNVIRKVGPSAARHGDNPMQKVMKNDQIEEASKIHKDLVYAYRDYLKESDEEMGKDEAIDLAKSFVKFDIENRKRDGLHGQHKAKGQEILKRLKEGGWWISGVMGEYLLKHATDRSISIPLGKMPVSENSIGLSELRKSFWRDNPEYAKYHNSKKRQNDYPATIRTAWVDYVDNAARSGMISDKLAQRATL